MSKLIILCGVPGSGKSTKAAKLEKGGFFRLSADAIRGELYGDENVQGDQYQIFGILYKRFSEALKAGKDIVIDNTNINRKARARYVREGRDKNYDIFLWLMPMDVERAIAQNNARERVVPEDVIRKRFISLKANLPTKEEGIVVKFK